MPTQRERNLAVDYQQLILALTSTILCELLLPPSGAASKPCDWVDDTKHFTTTSNLILLKHTHLKVPDVISLPLLVLL